MSDDFYRGLETASLRVLCAVVVLFSVPSGASASSRDGGAEGLRVYEIAGRRWVELPVGDSEEKRCLLTGGRATAGLLRHATAAPVAQSRLRICVPEPLFSGSLQLCTQSRSGAWRFGPIANLSEVTGQLLQGGEVVINEFMSDPSSVPDHKGEWIELENRLPHRVNLEGWRLRDLGGDIHTLDVGGAGLWVAKGERFLIGRSADLNQNGGVLVDYVMSGFSLSNQADEIFLEWPSGDLSDAVLYSAQDSWPLGPGMSTSLNPSSEGESEVDDPDSWCGVPWGTPGIANADCR